MKNTPQMGDEAVRASWSILAMDCESCVESSHVNNKNVCNAEWVHAVRGMNQQPQPYLAGVNRPRLNVPPWIKRHIPDGDHGLGLIMSYWWPGGPLLTPDRASVGGKMLE